MRIRQFLDPVIVIGTLVSVLFSIVLYFSGVENTTSVIIGFLGIIISLLIDLIARFTQTEGNVLSTLDLSSIFLKDPWFHMRITDVIQAWESINCSKNHPLFEQLAREAIQNLRNHLVEIASGEMTVGASDFRVLTVLLEEATSTLQATSLVSVEFWNSSVGQKYWNKHQEAIERNVDIVRIFICEKVEKDLLELAKKMQEGKVNILIASADKVPIELQKDFVIADNRLVITAELSSDLNPREHRISSQPEDVQKALGDFERLQWYADKLETVLGQENAI